MSQSGPFGGGPSQPIPGRSDGPYTMPVDPWHDSSAPAMAAPAHQLPWGGPPAPPPTRRPRAMTVTLVVATCLLVVGGLGIGVFLLTGQGRAASDPAAAPSAKAAASVSVAASLAAQDARFATTGQCVRNEGSEEAPQIRMAVCGRGSYEVLKRIDGTTSGEKDAESKCAAVPTYTNWYFYDSELDGLDFVLCLRSR